MDSSEIVVEITSVKVTVATTKWKEVVITDPEIEGGEYRGSIEVPLQTPMLDIIIQLSAPEEDVEPGCDYIDDNNITYRATSKRELTNVSRRTDAFETPYSVVLINKPHSEA
jgi:hypothetical protein